MRVTVWYTLLFAFKHKTAYCIRISYWSSDVCSSDLSLVEGTGGLMFPERLCNGYRAFLGGRFAGERSRYEMLAEAGQKPEIMVISCVDEIRRASGRASVCQYWLIMVVAVS